MDGSPARAAQGYVTMAYGARKFFEMAGNLALSLKLNDAGRPLTLLHKPEEPVPAHLVPLFDCVRPFENVERFPGVTIKLAIYEPTPYDEAFYIDSDCLLLKADMDRHWKKFGGGDFNIAGEIRREGSIYGLDARKLMAAAGTPYVIDGNCGIVFFRKNPGGAAVFETAREYCAWRLDEMREVRPRRGDGLSDQPFFSAAMAKGGIEPVSYAPEEGTIMATTYRAADVDFDFEPPRGALKKATGFRIADRFWARGWVSHDTTFAHFVALEPRMVYQRLSDRLRERFGFEKFDFS